MTVAITIGTGALGFTDLRRTHAGPVTVELDPAALSAIDDGARTVGAILRTGAPVYGVNTGFGKLAQQRIEAEELGRLQVNLVRSHAAGTGPPLAPDVVRLVLLLKIASLARGHSGVRTELVAALVRLLNADVLPVIPSQGSVGASGDLAPLAHLSLVLIGEGEATVGGRRVRGAEALAAADLAPVTLAPKEGLALLNGTQVSTALVLAALFETERTFRAALAAGAMAVDAVLGSDTPFDPRIQAVRPHPGQAAVAATLMRLLAGSQIRASHLECERVQDPYSFRCQPQVMGACLDLLHDVARKLVVEANAVTDNPLVFPREGEVLSGGNFHAEPVAFAADILALAIAEIGAQSERRTAAMIDSGISSLPPFLVAEPGLDSGFMMAQVTAAALASENRALATPHSVDSLPTSANQEDHVSMSTNAALRLRRMGDNARAVVAIELCAAAQGIDFRRPLKSSPAIEALHARIRAQVPHWVHDRVFAGDLKTMVTAIDGGLFDGVGDPLFDYAEPGPD